MRKAISILINVLAAIAAVVTLCYIHIRFPEGNIIGIINSPVYEKTDDFSTLVNTRVNDIFSLINLKVPFEHNGELNYDKIIAESIDTSGNMQKWTISECLKRAADHGFYIDTQYNVSRIEDSTALPFNKKNTYNFILKTYPSKLKNGSQSEEDFITEIITALSTYYKASSKLSENNNNFYYRISFLDENGDTISEYKNCNLTNNDYLNSRAFIYLSSKDNIITSNIGYVSTSTMKKAKSQNPYPGNDFLLFCSIDTTFQNSDDFREAYTTYNELKSESGSIILISIASLILFVISLFTSFYYIFSTKRDIDENQKFFFSIPTEFHFFIYIALTVAFIFAVNNLVSSNFLSTSNLPIVRLYLYVLVIYISTLIFFTILSHKYADGTLYFALMRLKSSDADNVFVSLPPAATLFVMFIPIIIFTAIAFYSIYIYTLTAYKPNLIIGLILLIATFGFVIYLLLLHNAFNKSLSAQTKSNDMRTSLIANVSHDIKTPLTSIINYTNLITEEIDKPSKSFKKNLTHYSEIVTDKANRLNDLINELIFESKVSTGNVKLDMQKIDTVAFLTQVITEFKDKLKTLGIKVLYEHNDTNAYIMADSKQLYRVFQNLFSNLYKYALEKSRVYIDLVKTNNKITITIKNIQREKLEVDVDTLKDRFVRGSKSRTTEGFGLGLSISESLVKSMGGKLEIKNVRDEFITIIKFIAYNE